MKTCLGTVSALLFAAASAIAFQATPGKHAIPSYAEIRQIFSPLDTSFTSPANPVSEQKANLGRMLYYDKRLSKDGRLSCNSCHPLDQYGVDHLPVSIGISGQKGTRNAPTVYNAAGEFAEFWDGREPDVEHQAGGPILNPIEMGMPSKNAVVAAVKSISGYDEPFHAAFPGQKDPITFVNIERSIANFERKLLTPSRWDDFLSGNESALSSEEKAGAEKFVAIGCSDCHAGPLVGGQKFEKLGFAQPWPDRSDLGRIKVTKRGADEFLFKVPSLRNVAETGPYFHTGNVGSLENAVRLMAKHQLGIELTDSDVASLVMFLKTLTGKIPADYVHMPTLP